MIKMEIDRLSVDYYKKNILNNISVRIQGGQLVSVIGPNGTGKTTFIKAIAQIIKHSGKIKLEENGQKLSRREVAYVPQMTTPTTDLTVFEMVLLGRVRDLTWKVEHHHLEAVSNILQDLGLISLSKTSFSKLSGGQRQLVTMAQALVSNPKVLLLDEPTSALDLRHQLQVMDIAKKYTKENDAITLVVLHDLALAARYSDQLCLLHKGNLVKTGTPQEVLDPNLLEQVYKVEVDVSVSKEGYTTVTPTRPSMELEYSL